MNTLMTFEEASADIIASEHKRVALFDKNGAQIVPFNSKNISIDKRLGEIEKRLASKSTADGVYQIHAKHYGAKAQPALYYVSKGNPDKSLSEIEIKTDKVEVEYPQAKSGFISIEEHNKLYKEKLELSVENDRLNKELSEANAYIEELESGTAETVDTEEEQSGFLSENTKSFLSQSLEQVLPLVDKMLEQRDKKLQLEELNIKTRLLGVPNGGHPQNVPVNGAPMHGEHLAEQPDELTEEEEMHLDAMEILKQNHPELYRTAMAKIQSENEQ